MVNQILVLNPITGDHATGVEGDGERLVMFVHSGVPFGGVFVW